uniref:REST corepressor 2 n=1 Tax=Melopsittacus undulatus TaxID=13146 RepID=A0A8V5GPK8_MELUD
MIRVGADYQAVIPDCKPGRDHRRGGDYGGTRGGGPPFLTPSTPSPESPALDKYIAMAKDKHGYNIEQALGMLLWHKHDVEKSLADLANFTPFPDEWTVEDKVLFEQAFSFHGKSFARIQQMLPDKLIPSLVKYYYSWKKTRSRTSVMDRQARRLLGRKDREDSNDETDDPHPTLDGDMEAADPKKEPPYPKPCTRKEAQYRHHLPPRHRRRPPRGMHLSREAVAGVTSNPELGAAGLRQLDCQLVSLKRQVQRIKQINSGLKQALEGGVEGLRPPEVGLGSLGVPMPSMGSLLCPTVSSRCADHRSLPPGPAPIASPAPSVAPPAAPPSPPAPGPSPPAGAPAGPGPSPPAPAWPRLRRQATPPRCRARPTPLSGIAPPPPQRPLLGGGTPSVCLQ